MKIQKSDRVFWVLGLVVVAALVYGFVDDDCTLLTADQQAYRLYDSGDYEAAAGAFADPMWQGVALFKQGEFEQAAGVLPELNRPRPSRSQIA